MSIEFWMPTLIELASLEENAKLCNGLKRDFYYAESCCPGGPCLWDYGH